MHGDPWYLIIGLVFVVTGLSVSWVHRMPVTTAFLSVLAGVAIGPYGLAMLVVDPLASARLLEHVSEIAVVISLFTAGLKLRVPLRNRRWRAPVLLATLAMAIGVALMTAIGWIGLGLPLGAALLLAAILAPTDPVLASDVQVESPADGDRLRFALTGEAGLNDGTAFPFVMLGLGLLGLHDVGAFGWRWLAVDLVWAVGAGLGIGWATGKCVGRLALFLRRERQEAIGSDDFLALGLIAISYGLAVLLHAYGFLAVFAAGLAVRTLELEQLGEDAPPRDLSPPLGDPQRAAHRRDAPAYMARAMLFFNEHLERMGEVAIVVLVGALLDVRHFVAGTLGFAALVLFAVRPLSVLPLLRHADLSPLQGRLVAWFGIRGVGSIYYLMFAINQGIDPQTAERLIGITLAVVTASIVVHGISVTPLMQTYRRISGRDGRRIGTRRSV
jgi:NhaP-type Na+/H+ or K+/H+ antiporter